MAATGHERQGWCLPCRTLWSWVGDPDREHALCPQCRTPLARKPVTLGRHARESRTPVELHVPELRLGEEA